MGNVTNLIDLTNLLISIIYVYTSCRIDNTYLDKYSIQHKQTVKCTCITLYTYTVHCTTMTKDQSVRRQHEKRTSEKSEMVTCEDIRELLEICDFDLSEVNH